MASATDSARNDEADLALTWSGRWTLAHRILAVNVLTLGVFAIAILTLDAYRNQLENERVERTEIQAQLAAAAIGQLPDGQRDAYIAQLGQRTGARFRLYDRNGQLAADGWRTTGPTYAFRDPAAEAWRKGLARTADRAFAWLVGDPIPEEFAEPAVDNARAWEEVAQAASTRTAVTNVRSAADLTPVFSAAAPVADGTTLLVTTNDRDFTRTVRAQRRTLIGVLIAATILSALLSIFLARTIVRPLRRIALAAHRVRLGRAREVRVPRLPSRRDEIGMLARSVSDMSQSLRHRIDQIEAFAADVTHELKNPLASLRSAVESLERVDDPSLRTQLLDVVRHDVVRLDRLIGDISEAARTDAELARARFEPVDLGGLVDQVAKSWSHRSLEGDVRLAFARPRKGSTMVLGEPGRLARAIDNLIDNALSFSPLGGLVEVVVSRVGDDVLVRIDDEGPGVPDPLRETIFNRFHSVRPESEDFGRHSGLGLAIAKAIVEGHDGKIDVTDRDDAPSGARFIIRLPASDTP